MDKLSCMRAFVCVVESGGFSPAARRLSVSKALISKQIGQLEESLGTRLLHRTTRRVSPTSSGQAYFEQCRSLLKELDELDASVQSSDSALQGEIRISAPVTFAEMHLIPIISLYSKQNPEVKIHLDLTDRFVNLVEERIDLAIRIGELEDSSLVTRRIGEIQMTLCASPSYLKKHKVAESIEALTEHQCIIDTNNPAGRNWSFISADKTQTIKVADHIQVNNARAASELVLSGNGIGFLPSFVVGAKIQNGELVRILHNYSSRPIGIYAVYLHRKHLSPKVRRLIDLLIESFKQKSK